MNRPRADYSYDIVDDFLIIEDLNLGRMSVTNCIEDVVEEISKTLNVDPVNWKIIYRDSDGIWDGWNHANYKFISLNEKSLTQAIIRYESLR
jgi:hypothetical protein